MAHVAKLNTLADELVRAVTGLHPTGNVREFKKAKELVARSTRSTQFARTNQFDVEERYQGLQEKFFIRNRDDIAKALQVRLKELRNRKFKWQPEALSFLLQLSDQPAKNTNLEDIERLAPEEPPPLLTWAEIIAEDPLDEEGIWDDIDYTAVSSEDDLESEIARRKPARRETSADQVYENASPEVCTISIDVSRLDSLKQSQFWRPKSSSNSAAQISASITTNIENLQHMTELQAIREILFMLGALPTSLFTNFKDERSIAYSGTYTLEHTSHIQFVSILDEFSAIGSDILRLRRWAEQHKRASLLQAFQHEVDRKLEWFDGHLARLHQQHVHTSKDVLVSLQQVLSTVQSLSQPLQRLSRVVVHVAVNPSVAPHMYLESLFEATCAAQLAGELETYEALGDIFFNCFRTYLRPIREWMMRGDLSLDTESFFIKTANAKSETSSLWHDRFNLRFDESENLYAPNFLHPSTKKIFNTGKSVVFLQELGYNNETWVGKSQEPLLGFKAVCCKPSGPAIEPFGNLFETAFEAWIQSKHNLAADILREQLYTKCGLWRSLDALELIFLSKDGYTFQSFADTLFQKQDSKASTWNDRFVLTEAAQRIFGETEYVETGRLAIRTTVPKHKGSTIKNLTCIAIDYSLPWPVLNVVQRKVIPIYQQTFQLILQIYRAQYLLQRCPIAFAARRENKTARLAVYLRHRLLWFADNMRSYIVDVTLPKHTMNMRHSLAGAVDIDTMAKVHADYVKTLQDQCMLSKNLAPITQSIISVLDLSVTIHDALSRHTQKQSTSGKSFGKSSLRRSRLDRQASQPSAKRSDSDGSSSDESESEEEGGYGGDDEDVPASVTLLITLERAQEQFDRLCPFIVSGLKGVSRSRGDQDWQLLSEKLDWKIKGGYTF